MTAVALKRTSRRAALRFIVEIEIGERLPGRVPHDEARIVRLIGRPGQREVACGGHGAMIAQRRPDGRSGTENDSTAVRR